MGTYRDRLTPLLEPDQKWAQQEREQTRQEKQTHAGLWFDKYITTQAKDGKGRRTLVNEVAALPIPETYLVSYKRWEKMLVDSGAKIHKATVKGRMVVGLGDESVIETSVALHHTYGVPYIPGSALKGLAANYTHQRLGDTWKKESDAYKVVFGDTNNAGYVTFFDALYIPNSAPRENGPILYPDVITVHHQGYYQGKDNVPPADWDSPIPIPFLSATGSYLIALAAHELDEPDIWLTRTFEILANALHERGIGAKTSSGYGRVEIEGVAITQPNTDTEDVQKEVPPVKRDRQHVKPPVVGSELIQEARGIKDSTSLRNRFHLEDAVVLLSYRDYDPLDIVVAISSDYPEAASWNDGNSHRCRVEQVDEREEGFVLFCKPVTKKNKTQDKKKKK